MIANTARAAQTEAFSRHPYRRILLRRSAVVGFGRAQEETIRHDSTVVRVRTGHRPGAAFTEAVQRAHTPTGAALRHFLQPYARDSLRRKAARQCQIAAAAPDAAESLSLIEDVQDVDDA